MEESNVQFVSSPVTVISNRHTKLNVHGQHVTILTFLRYAVTSTDSSMIFWSSLRLEARFREQTTFLW